MAEKNTRPAKQCERIRHQVHKLKKMEQINRIVSKIAIKDL